jgi:ribosomal protein L37AE/L43A
MMVRADEFLGVGRAHKKRTREEENDARDVKFCKKCNEETHRNASTGQCAKCKKAQNAKYLAERKKKGKARVVDRVAK